MVMSLRSCMGERNGIPKAWGVGSGPRRSKAELRPAPEGITPHSTRSWVGGAVLKIYTKTGDRSEEHTSELQSRLHLVCRLLLEKKKKKKSKKKNNHEKEKELWYATMSSEHMHGIYSAIVY